MNTWVLYVIMVLLVVGVILIIGRKECIKDEIMNA